MGCCTSCCGEDNAEVDNENSPLLRDSSTRAAARKITSNGQEHPTNHNVSVVEQRENDEQSILNAILTQTMTSIIDVSAIDSHGVEHHEYVGRMKNYNQAMNAIPAQSLQRRRPNALLAETQNVEKVLSQPPIADDYLTLVRNFAQNTHETLAGIHIEPQEDLVVQFGAPIV